MLAQGPLVNGPLVFIPTAGSAVTTTMPAVTRSFALTGVAAILKPALVAAVGPYGLTGIAATLTPKAVAVAVSYSFTGVTVAYRVTIAQAPASFALTGLATVLTPKLGAGIGSYALTGIAPSFVTRLGAATRAYNISWQTFSDNDSLAAGTGIFWFTGNTADLSYDIDLGGRGGRIVTHHAGDELRSGTPFTKRRFQDLVDQVLADQEAKRAAAEQERRRAAELRRAADAQAKVALRVRWAQEDALAAAAAQQRTLQDTLAMLAGIARMREAGEGAALRHQQALHQQALQAQRRNDEEEEAIALLLLDP